MIIGINGRMRSGKDTVAQMMLNTYHGTERVAFADKLKDSVCALFGITRQELDDLKNDPMSYVAVGTHGGDGKLATQVSTSMRSFLQRYGTEAHRDIFGTKFWVEAAFTDVEWHGYEKLILVTDCRFQNEADFIKELGGFIVKVVRDEAEQNAGSHSSEQDLNNVDFYIDNNGTLEDLAQEVKRFFNWMLDHPRYGTGLRIMHNHERDEVPFLRS